MNNFRITGVLKRMASTGTYPGSTRTTLPRRPMKKIHLGKSRPAIYHQFDVAVELSDGSVIMRRSQFPKAEIRLIQDQRNNPLWNRSRSDLVVVDANSAGSINKFKQKYSSIFSVKEAESAETTETTESENVDKQTAANEAAESKTTEVGKATIDGKEAKEVPKEEKTAEDNFDMDDYLSLLDDSSKQIKSGKIASKKRAKK